jgi:hypothetical protein
MAKSSVSRYGPPHFEREGYVSIWATIAPLSRIPDDYCVPSYGDEDENKPLSEFSGDFGFGYYDLDDTESYSSDGRAAPMRDLLKYLSYSSSFIEQAEKAAKRKSLEKTQWVFLIYDFDYQPKVTKVSESKYMRFLGSFEFDRNSEPVEKWDPPLD